MKDDISIHGQIPPQRIPRKDHCSYCGSVYDLQRDHVIPTSYLREKRKYEGDWLVTACGECNRTLGDRLIFNVPDRALWVSVAYDKKYHKLLHAVVWDDEDLEDVGRNLRSLIIKTQREAADVSRRMAHLKLVISQPITYLANLRPTIDPTDEDVPEFIDDDYHTKRARQSLVRSKARTYYRYSNEQ